MCLLLDLQTGGMDRLVVAVAQQRLRQIVQPLKQRLYSVNQSM